MKRFFFFCFCFLFFCFCYYCLLVLSALFFYHLLQLLVTSFCSCSFFLLTLNCNYHCCVGLFFVPHTQVVLPHLFHSQIRRSIFYPCLLIFLYRAIQKGNQGVWQNHMHIGHTLRATSCNSSYETLF